MTDDLHKRIAQTIYDNCGMVFYRCEDVAKAIIDAHLRPERWKTDDPRSLRGDWTRYVTDWSHPDA